MQCDVHGIGMLSFPATRCCTATDESNQISEGLVASQEAKDVWQARSSALQLHRGFASGPVLQADATASAREQSGYGSYPKKDPQGAPHHSVCLWRMIIDQLLMAGCCMQRLMRRH